ncbi:hypothetical protein CONCODRAFT_62017 [Conidiobolus coronatus NRRL 28638]|uniref:GOLD domain-containing protein n=1 Tax=Conidiobolus coronatus (strain ATCC 28846 / CBS 209.66 / NRRL 28638) TaxID=796925 RepID=A0A137NSV4_CONC2|nr:hypothetical protein CONCODRAFT_62017 [Conidiobolus coronatus NRRL 28638]|eukprot:KXN65811.1 hypothetical protein CONCODRAFT_62017 [Conidiobolus coronatus NRRL 28638]
MKLTQFILSILIYSYSVLSFTVTLKAFSRDCWFEHLNLQDVLLISYDVVSGGDQLVDFELLNPSGASLQSTPAKKDAYYHYNATDIGNHKFCFNNGPNDKSLSFHTNVIKKDAAEKVSKGQDADKIEEEFLELERLINQINSARSAAISRSFYINKQNNVISKRIAWWGIFQIITLVAVCAWQTYYIRKFFEIRRVV